jgi:isopenicillin N synthase-like dioxygenase
MITILLQDDVGGLEVENAAGEWISAPPIPGTFVINLGEMVRVLTNGMYHANLHRVLNNHSGKDRFSVPTFFDPNYSTRSNARQHVCLKAANRISPRRLSAGISLKCTVKHTAWLPEGSRNDYLSLHQHFHRRH